MSLAATATSDAVCAAKKNHDEDCDPSFAGQCMDTLTCDSTNKCACSSSQYWNTSLSPAACTDHGCLDTEFWDTS